MNTLTLLIKEKGTTYRKGFLYNNNQLIMSTLEPTDRNLSIDPVTGLLVGQIIPGKSAIPKGTYQIQMLWSQKFEMKTPHLMNVPGFTEIEMHVGNSSVDTEGCILVGLTDKQNKDWIGLSLTATRILYKLINDHINEGWEITITENFTQVLEKS